MRERGAGRKNEGERRGRLQGTERRRKMSRERVGRAEEEEGEKGEEGKDWK